MTIVANFYSPNFLSFLKENKIDFKFLKSNILSNKKINEEFVKTKLDNPYTSCRLAHRACIIDPNYTYWENILGNWNELLITEKSISNMIDDWFYFWNETQASQNIKDYDIPSDILNPEQIKDLLNKNINKYIIIFT